MQLLGSNCACAAALARALRSLYCSNAATQCCSSSSSSSSTSHTAAAALLQRLQSTAFGASSGSSSSSTFSSLAPALLSTGSILSQCIQQPSRCSGSSPCDLQTCNSSSIRGYARAPPPGVGRSRRPPSQRHDRHQPQQQHHQQPQGSGGASGRGRPGPPPRELTQLQLGRVAALCVPTQQLREPVVEARHDPWKDQSREAMSPRQLDGSYGDDLEDVLMMRQQLENSALPNEFKRSRFISPAWDEVLLQVKRTVKVTRGGKVETLHALVAVGNHDGLLGIGEHSGKNIQKVMLDAQLKAYKNLVAIPRYRKHTVFHPIDLKKRKVRIQVWPRVSGFGITASPLMTTLCDLAGVRDVTIKLSGRRRNIRNVVDAFVDALGHRQSVPHDGVEGSGVYVREVFSGPLYWGLRRGVDLP